MENLIQVLIQHSDGVAMVDGIGLITFWNSSLAEITGIPEEEAIGRNIWELQSELTPQNQIVKNNNGTIIDSGAIKELWQTKEIISIAKNQGRQKREFCFQRKNGSLVCTEQHFYTFDHQGEPYFCVFLHDVTLRKRNEKIMEDQNNAMTHDLKNPLNAILGFSSKGVYQDADPDDLPGFFDRINNSGEKMLKIIDSALLRSRAERGEKVDKKMISLPKILASVKHEFDATIKNASLETNYDYSKMLLSGSLEIAVEETLFSSVLINLLKNGAEALPADDPEKRVFLKISWEREKLIITIRNKGEVPIEIRDRLFQKYVTYGKTNGNGLGLSTAKAIIEAHNGSITYLPEPGETTFKIEIPIA